MGRKRILKEKKRVAYNISIEKAVLDDFKETVKENDEVASRIIQKFMEEYLKGGSTKKY